MGEAASSELPSLDDIFGPGGRLSACLPIYEYRPQQVEAAQAVQEALQGPGRCIVEAGTGVGKTLAYLIPVAQALAGSRTAVVSTYTINLQTQLIEKDIPVLAAVLPEVEIRACLLKGKSNYLCKQDLEQACADLFHTAEPMFDRLRKWAARTRTGDVGELPFTYPRWHEVAANQDTCRVRDCRFFDTCHYYRARRRAAASNLIVVNHALLLTDLVTREASEDGSGLLPDYDLLVLDEAHHLEDAATTTLSLSLAEWEIPAFTERVRRLPGVSDSGGLLSSINALHDTLFERLRGAYFDYSLADRLGPEGVQATMETAAALSTSLRKVHADLAARLADAEDDQKERIEGLQQAALRLADAAGHAIRDDEPGRLQWCEVKRADHGRSRRPQGEESRLLIHSTPIEVGDLLAQHLWSRPGDTVLTSATLAASGGFGYLRSRLGLSEPAIERIIGSPFDFATQALLYVPGHLPAPPREFDAAYTDLMVDEIGRLVSLTEGRAFLLFTSRKALREVYARLKAAVPYPLFRQGDMPPQRLLTAYRESGNGILLGNQTFWEGVDVQGSALSAVIIDRIPFAVPDSPITKARTDAVVASGCDPFRELSIPQAQIRLKQGFGRLIRTRTDRGIVCVLDSRLVTRRYGRLFVENLPPAARASTWSRVERFWYA